MDSPYQAGYFSQVGTMKDKALLVHYLPYLRPYIRPESHILDIGCGTGAFLQLLGSQGYSNLYGIDISAFALQEAQKHTPNLKVCCNDLQSAISLNDQQFDLISCLDVIEHLINPFVVLQEIARLLKPGGILLLTTPNSNSILRYLRGEQWYALRDSSHLIYFNAFSLSYLVRKAGLRPKRQVAFSQFAPLRWIGSGGQLLMIAQK